MLGTILVVPSAVALSISDAPFTALDDLELGLSPIIRAPLETLRSGATIRLSYVVPSSSQWARIRRTQGPGRQGYVALAADTLRGRALDYNALTIEFSVSSNSRPLVLMPTRDIFLYEPFGADIGLRFEAAAGDRLQFAIRASNPEKLPDGEFLVQPYWDSAGDEAEAELRVDNEVKLVVTVAARIGLMLLVAGVVLQILKSQILKS